MGRPSTLLLAGLAIALTLPWVTAQEPATPATNCLTVEFHAVTEQELDKDGSGPEPATREKSEAKWSATLGPRRCAWQTDATLRTWDFELGVVRTIDRAARTYTEVSVLHEVAFVHMEMRNRLGLRGVLDAASIDLAGAWSPFDLAVVFGWPAAGDDTKLERVEVDGATCFLKDEQQMTQWRLGEHTLDEAQQAAFSRLLQRLAHLHPQARTALVATGRLPSELEFHWRSPGVSATTTWRLVAVHASAWTFGIEGYTRTFGDGPLSRLAKVVAAPEAEGVPARLSVARFAELAEAAGKQERFADAAMLLLESSLSHGDDVPQLRAIAKEPKAKDAMGRWMRPISLANRNPEQALSLFAELDRKELSRPAIVDVFRVNALRQQRKVDAARDLMLATLEQSPWITMAYKDLGDLFRESFATEAAWTAWELGRRVAPGHGCWQAVEQYEASLRREFAERL